MKYLALEEHTTVAKFIVKSELRNIHEWPRGVGRWPVLQPQLLLHRPIGRPRPPTTS